MSYRNARELWQDRFESFLKEGLDKKGSDANPGTSTDTEDETRSTAGTLSLYDNPDDRENVADDQNQQSSGVRGAYTETQHGVLDNAFSEKATAEKADQKLISTNFAHGASGDFESNAPLLQSKSKPQSTLMEKVRTTFGRH